MTGHDAGRQHAGRQHVQGVALVTDDDRVAGVVAALVPDDVIDPVAEQVGGLALAFVAPLGADKHDGGHRRYPFGWHRLRLGPGGYALGSVGPA